MDIIIGGRGYGKTRRCIERAAESGAYIVCSSKTQVDHVWKMVREMGLLDKVRYPITFQNILDGEFHRINCSGFIFDDVDLMIQNLSRGVPVELVSMTDENAWSVKAMESLIIGDDFIEDEKRNFTKEERDKIKKFYEKVVVPGLMSEAKGKYHDVEGPGDSSSPGCNRE